MNKSLLIRLFCTLGLFWTASHFLAAQSIPIIIQPVTDIPDKLNIPKDFSAKDSADASTKLRNLRFNIVEAGYLTAGFDSLNFGKDTIYAFLNFGNKYKWANLDKGNIPEEYLTAIGFREKLYRNEPFSPKALSKIMEQALKLAENNGFPFASLTLDSLKFRDGEIDAQLNIELNQFTLIDSVIIKGGANTNRNYLQSYLGIKTQVPYSQSVLDKIPGRLKELSFLRVIKPYEVGMRPGKADIYLYLDNKKASNFNGIIGILPDRETGKTQITGDVELNLLNTLKHGETIKLKWQRLQTKTQELNLEFDYPFLFSTPIGIEAALNLYRRDTIFSQVNALAGLQYYFKGGNFARIFYENNQANVISSDAFSINQYIDSRTNMYGVGLNFRRLDYRYNPTKGFFVETSVAAGQKTILKNPEVDDSEYDDLNLKSDIYNAKLNTGKYIPIGNRSTFLLRVRGAYLLNENMFRNEIYRIGGLKTLRGFNEQSIFASAYAVGTLEYRFILEENSNVFAFFDQGIYEDRSTDNTISDTPFGFGAGINFETNAGIFSLTYALGKQFNNPIEIRSGKIHFGFISFF
ncbi:BamA/TamA family outer membrane protein [Cryomorpha ignava]|uniref:BamA/TamA family outer membrane protein n=1 Tax=Cryomorpha ignava TaxID=101383 RepID=A0A7K3WPC2_9FLAO|nr:BamA/TamA family outer membrane protein [Cryomorpha ignava]NEN23487.1 BamA/TamA family outer membrane protein [Cryomorpha ignava]